MADTQYNGWKNYETWNVALWIGNDEGLYSIGKECEAYADFQDSMKSWGWPDPLGWQTPDSVAWSDSGLDIKALDEMIGEL